MTDKEDKQLVELLDKATNETDCKVSSDIYYSAYRIAKANLKSEYKSIKEFWIDETHLHKYHKNICEILERRYNQILIRIK